jgi:hypothetical protein
MKLFLDDFNVFNDQKIYLNKLWLCFDKYWKLNISLKLKKCMLKVYSKVILGYIVWIKEGKLLDLKKFFAIINIPPPKTPKDIQILNGIAQFYHCFI